MSEKSNKPILEEGQAEYASLRLKVMLLGGLVVLVIVALIVLWQTSGKTVHKVAVKKMVAKPARVLRRLLKKQERLLAADGVSDEARGKYRIPVERAMRILVENPKLIAPLPKVVVPPTSAPTLVE